MWGYILVLTIIALVLFLLIVILSFKEIFKTKDANFKEYSEEKPRTTQRAASFMEQTSYTISEIVNDPGINGEYQLYKYLIYYAGEDAKILCNLYPRLNDDNSTQVDAVLINSDGIFVFESKNCSGDIYGNEYDEHWLKIRYKDKTSVRFQNPLNQNLNHIKMLEKILGDDYNFYSVIAFSNNATIRNRYDYDDTFVVRYENIGQVLDRVKNINLDCSHLDQERIDKIFNELKKYLNPPAYIKAKHLSYAKTQHRN